MAEVITRDFLRPMRRARDLRAVLLDSVPLEVKMISSGCRVDEGGYLFACGLQGGFDGFRRSIAGRGVVEMVFEERKHRLQHLGVDGSGGVVIEVNHGGSLVLLGGKARRILRENGKMRAGGLFFQFESFGD